MNTLNIFDKVAKYYDLIASVVFGGQIKSSQKYFLRYLNNSENVLIIGGGTGWIAKEILLLYPKIKITYVEASLRMIEETEQKLQQYADNVIFIHGTEESLPKEVEYDAIIANFFLDLFKEEQLQEVVSKLKRSTRKDSLWLVSDFQDKGVWWQRVLLRSMFLFFRFACGIHLKRLPNWKNLFSNSKFVVLDSKDFFRGFIHSVVYKIY
ncbi:class I SAM-dependent methyltransferase [Chryseosolibacter indicus]|uniref:Methyltransferase domain-containing protein n=1 Tax=Chryseosolibacter indicus TaxID=2782351 RepID=A0ABS5VMI2_9BACT|nr:class I SAM-dependent methyltransferase [Chryseosolibacter indicus]MBT1702660.1 methyltransferase domain-containing protein [Chryseosolibacter indicus]